MCTANAKPPNATWSSNYTHAKPQGFDALGN